jgi:glucose uptake protein GlcU
MSSAANRLRRPVLPPEKLTAKDVIQIALGALMVPLGAIIAVRTFATIRSLTGVLVGGVFMAFGAYRLYQGYTRYRILRQRQRKV